MASSKLEDLGFKGWTVPYKTVDGVDILVDIGLPPGGLPKGKHPIVVQWHGGALVTGARDLKDIFPKWLPSFAAKHNAIVVSPDHRLLPEANGDAILEDLESFWDWLHNRFPQTLSELTSGQQQAELDHLLLTGSSAGGYLATQQALAHPDQVRVLMINYPMLHIDRTPRPPYTGPLLYMLGVLMLSREELDKEAAELRQKTKVFLGGGWERTPLAFSALSLGATGDWLGSDPKFDVYQRVRNGERLPKKVWLTHGTEDSVVELRGSEAFAAVVRNSAPGTDLRVKFFPGDHGSDTEWDPVEFEKGLEWVSNSWLKG